MVLDTIFGFLLNYEPSLAVTIFSIITLILINIFYKVLINQNDARLIKERTKELSKQMRVEQKAGNTKKHTELMGDMMKENSNLMKLTLKPMIVSFVIVLVMLPWLHIHYGDQIAAVENNAGLLKFEGVDYPFTVSEDNKTLSLAGAECELPCTSSIGRMDFEIVREGADKVKFAPIVAMSPVPLPLTGTTVGWLMWYLIVSIPFVMLIRKLMKIYV